jgi:aspartyl-tRNA(Asn)/glutamyl-tRNA(Gln) amidotransferase subunit C
MACFFHFTPLYSPLRYRTVKTRKRNLEMKIDPELVDKVAALANLEFDEREKQDFAAQFAEIVRFVEQLSEVETTGIESDDIHGRPDNVLAEDAAEKRLNRDQALANAPERDGEFFLVPKVIVDE